MQVPKIILKKKREESLKRKHPWIFSGAIASVEGEPDEGDIVEIYNNEGGFEALGHCQMGSIAVRVLSFKKEQVNSEWWTERITRAYEMRKTIGLIEKNDTNCYRLIHGEGDNLPGLVIDVYDQVAVTQCHSIGMYFSREEICASLRKVYGNSLTAIYDKSSQTLPVNSGLENTDQYLWRSECFEKNISSSQENIVEENGNKFYVNWERGQKTGFFIDQRENRELVQRYASGKRVLNTFCYTGGFSVYALAGGAISVDSVDSSQFAVELAQRNVELNFGEITTHKAITGDAIEYVKNMADKYDMIILDPPAFAKHNRALANALQGYKRLNAAALGKIKKGGILFTFSCSQAVSRDSFRTAVFSAASIAGRSVSVLHQLSQPADHPVSIYHPEGEYLKGLVLYVE